MQQSDDSTLKLFASLTAAERAKVLRAAAGPASPHSRLPADAVATIVLGDWRVIGRPKQQPPDWAWTYWLLSAGRGFGKTISAAQWAKTKVLERQCRFALIAPTFADGRDTMIEGETGLLSVLPPDALRGQSRESGWNRSIGELYLANDSKFRIFSSEKPDRLRGPQHDYAWCEEISSWLDAGRGDALDSTWSNMKLSTRLGEHPQIVMTTTPKPNRLTKDVLAMSRSKLALSVGSSYENRDNLSEAWWQEVVAPYEGTRLGRQEIHAELLEDVEGALWTRMQLDTLRVQAAPTDLGRILVGVDPNVTSSEAANSAGIIVAALANADKHGYVLADRTTVRGGPRAWAQAAVDAYHDFDADRVIAEANNGGEMVEIMIKTVDASVPMKLVRASRGKRTRAEPIAALYEGSDTVPPSVHHVGVFPELEDEMCFWTPEAESPDRMDALVWALTELMLNRRRQGQATTHVPRGRIPNVAARNALTPF